MKNYIIYNKYLHSSSFLNVYKRLENAFLKEGQTLIKISNDIAEDFFKEDGKGQPVLFFDKDILLGKILEKRGYRLINPINVVEICDDKSKTYVELFGKVDMPKTVLPPFTFSNIGYDNLDFIKKAEEKLGFPMVVKKTKGSFGNEVYLVKNEEELLNIIKEINSSEFLMQEYIESSSGKDLRVYVVGGKAVAYAKRENKLDFRSNVERGGKMAVFDAPKSYIETSEKVAKILGADFLGVDLLFGKDGPILCEANSNALFNGLSDVTNIDVAKEICDYYLKIKK